MTKQDKATIDQTLVAALRGERTGWPAHVPVAGGLERVLYHGIAGLLIERTTNLVDWPGDLLKPVREQAIAQAMWEMRHKPLLAAVLADFARHGISALLLKGSALAYDLYDAPAARSRGDSDVLINTPDLRRARELLKGNGFERATPTAASDGLALQEIWIATDGDGTKHHVDLHWQLLNAPALRGVMEFGACAAEPLALPRLGPGAQAMNRVLTLLHTCIHRAMHITNPYFVGGQTYYGGDRLIWAHDIHLLGSALSDAEWQEFTSLALSNGVAEVCLKGLDVARDGLGTIVPRSVIRELTSAEYERASAYLLSFGQARRSWADLLSIPGWRQKAAYAAARALPAPKFMRSKYPEMGDRPLAALYGRRVIELLRPRPKQSEQ